MTLAEIVASQRAKATGIGNASSVPYETRRFILAFCEMLEADPEFKLPERVDAMIADLERPYEPGLDRPTGKGIAKRMREDLGRL
jgi:hypothetical protein